MVKKIAAIAGGVFIGLVIAFARVGAFPFWGSDSDASKAPPAAQQAQAAPEPLPAPPVPGVQVAPPAPPWRVSDSAQCLHPGCRCRRCPRSTPSRLGRPAESG